MKNYPIFKPIIPEDCRVLANTPKSCTSDDIGLKLVGMKTLEESYILEYHCSEKAMLINALIKANIAPECQEHKLPLDAFLIDKTGIDTGNAVTNCETYQEEEMPAADYCHFKNLTTDKYLSDCSKMIHGVPYTDSINGYRLIPITSENRAKIYAEFEAEGFKYEASQAAMNEIADEFISAAAKTTGAEISEAISGAKISNEQSLIAGAKIIGARGDSFPSHVEDLIPTDAPQTWCEYLTGNVAGICDYFA